MTISLSDNDPRISYSVSQGVTQTTFTVPFEFFDLDDLNVYVDGTQKTKTTHYTLASGGSGSTGSITMSVTGATGGSTVVITRDIDHERTTDFQTSGPFNIASLNTELDRFTAIAADLQDGIDRSLRLTDFDAAASLVLPDVNTRKGKTLAFNASTGAVESGPSISDVQTVSAAAADIATLADIEDGTDSTDAIQTVAGISSNVSTVSGISANVTTVAGISSNVTSVAGNATNINTVAGINTNINTVAGISSNVTTVAGISSDVTAVAADATDIGAVAGKATEIGRLGTADAVADLALLGTSDAVSDMNTLAAISSNITTVAGVSANVTTVAGISSDVTAVAGDATDIGAVAAKATEIGRLGTAAAVADLAILGTTDAVSDMNTLAAISSNITTVAGVSSDVTTVAGISANTTTVAGISANVTTVAGISSDVTTVAGNNANVTTVAGANSNITTVAGSISNVNTVATNLSSINDFADKYRIGATDPTTNNDEGDLFYNTTSNTLKVYTGSAFEAGVTAGSGFAALTGATFTGDVTMSGANLLLGDSSGTDNNRVRLGANQDFDLFHDGNSSNVRENGPGGLNLRGSAVNIRNQGNTEDMAIFTHNGDVKLFYDDSEKFATTSAGIDVTGTAQADSFTLDNGSNDWTFTVSSNNLIFSYAGTAKMKLDSSGNLTVTGDVISEGTI